MRKARVRPIGCSTKSGGAPVTVSSRKLTFERRAWYVPSEDRAFASLLEGSPSTKQREAILARARAQRANWMPDAEAWNQLLQLQSFVGRRIRIQFWDDGTMWLLAEDEWPRPIEASCEGIVTLMDDGHLQAFLLLCDAVEIKSGGRSGLSYLVERGVANGKLASAADLYEIESIS